MTPVKFTTFGASSAIGGFGPGDVARVSDALARHLVEEIKVARYVEVPSAAAPLPPPPVEVPAEPPEPRKRGRNK